MDVCMYECMYVCTYERMDVCMYTYVRMYVCMYVCMYVRTYARKIVLTQSWTPTCARHPITKRIISQTEKGLSSLILTCEHSGASLVVPFVLKTISTASQQ